SRTTLVLLRATVTRWPRTATGEYGPRDTSRGTGVPCVRYWRQACVAMLVPTVLRRWAPGCYWRIVMDRSGWAVTPVSYIGPKGSRRRTGRPRWPQPTDFPESTHLRPRRTGLFGSASVSRGRASGFSESSTDGGNRSTRPHFTATP